MKDIKGTLILLDALIPEDPDVLELLEPYRKKLPNDSVVVGHSMVPLTGANECKSGECNLGNLLVDSMVYARVKMMSQNHNFKYYSDVSMAVLNAGGIRSSIDKKKDGVIMRADVKLILPFKGKYVIIEVSGKTIQKVLQHSASEYGANNAAGGILQMAGIIVQYRINMTEPEQKVASVEVACANCDIPQYEALNLSKKYKIIVPVYLYKGGGGYDFKEDGATTLPPVLHEFGNTDLYYLIDYLKDHDNIYNGLEGRITIDGVDIDGGVAKIFLTPLVLLCSIYVM